VEWSVEGTVQPFAEAVLQGSPWVRAWAMTYGLLELEVDRAGR